MLGGSYKFGSSGLTDCCQSLALHLQIRLEVGVRGLNALMAQPSSNHSEVYPRLEQPVERPAEHQDETLSDDP